MKDSEIAHKMRSAVFSAKESRGLTLKEIVNLCDISMGSAKSFFYWSDGCKFITVYKLCAGLGISMDSTLSILPNQNTQVACDNDKAAANRRDAIKSGVNKYSGQPCRTCGDHLRYTSNKNCVACTLRRKQKQRSKQANY